MQVDVSLCLIYAHSLGLFAQLIYLTLSYRRSIGSSKATGIIRLSALWYIWVMSSWASAILWLDANRHYTQDPRAWGYLVVLIAWWAGVEWCTGGERRVFIKAPR